MNHRGIKMKKTICVLSILSAVAMTFSMSGYSASAYCGLSAADLARANAQNNRQNYVDCNVYGYCSDCGSYESLCSEGTCGDCEATATDGCGVCYDCQTGGDCEATATNGCGVCYDCQTGGDCKATATDGCGVCYDCQTGGDCENGDSDEAAAPEASKAPVKSGNTAKNYDINSIIKSILSRLFINTDIDFGDYIEIPSQTEPTPSQTTPPTRTQPKPAQTQPKPAQTQPTTTTPVTAVPAEDCAEYAVEMLAMINEARAEVGAPALKLSSELCNAANIRAKEISSSFTHTRPNGGTFYSVLDDISYSGSRASGENIAAGNSGVSATFKQWMESQGHYDNMINAKYKYVGIGYYKTSSGYKYHWVQIFSY
jgi:uncharacterized protein YkwD